MPDRDVIDELRQLAAGASIEVTPAAAAAAPDLGTALGRGRTVYLPFPPRTDIADTLAACRRLVAEGLVPVPHLVARAVPSRRQLADWLGRLADAGADSVLLVAGDARKPRGPYPDTLAVLESGLLAEHGMRRVGVTGYPEGHPRIGSDALLRALERKAAYARETGTRMWLVSQFTFEAAPIAAWLRELADAGIDLPVRIGIPGPAQLRTLIGFALRCGVGASASAIVQRPSAALKLSARWEPDALVADLARLRTADGAPQFAGIHVFAFGGVAQSATWLDTLRDRPARTAGDADAEKECVADTRVS